MAVTFILGRAGTGKTRYCVDALLAELARPDDPRRLVLLVPEQASFQMERVLATRAPGGGYWRAEVLSFSRLARRVFSQIGLEPALLSPRARVLALRRVVARCGDSLPSLRPAVRTAGFFAQLDGLIEELLRENVPPDALRTAVLPSADAASARKVQEIARLYADYLAWLGPERTDPAARLAVLRERLAGVEWLRSASIWADGFAGFTGQELETLAALARAARDVTITLLLDPAAPAVRNPRQPPDPLGLFQRTEATYQRLLALFAGHRIEVRPPVELRLSAERRFARAPGLAALEAGLAAPQEALRTTGPPADVTLRACATHRAELHAAARWIRTRMADARGGLRFRDFAVIARDLEPFAHLIADVFAEYEIPYFLDRRRSMRAHPLSRLLPGLFDAARTGCDVPPMVRLLRTRLLPLSRDQSEQLENLVVNHAVRGLELWRRPAWELDRSQGAVDACAAGRARITAALDPLCALMQSPADPTGAAWAVTLHGVLEGLAVRTRIESWIAAARSEQRWEAAEMHRLAWEALCGILDDLHAVLGDTPVSAADAAAIVGSALAELTLGLAPPAVDQVLVSAIERSRHPDIKHAWVFAFNEGVFPARPPEDALLSTAERDALTRAGLPAPASHREDVFGERLLAYIACTRPSASLTISYAAVGDDGDPLPPSPLLPDILRALPGLTPVRVAEAEPPVCVAELAAAYLSTRRDDRRLRDQRRCARLCEHVQSSTPHAGRLARLLRGTAYTNHLTPLGAVRPGTGDPGLAWRGTPSEVETWLQCPFKHFARYQLRLDATRGPQPLRWDLGDVAHQILADVTRRALRETGSVSAISDARWQELLSAVAADFWQRQPADLAQRRPDFASLGQVLLTLLRDVVAAHAARWRRGRFQPLLCEQPFDPARADDALAGVELLLPDGRRMHLRGRIDRVDVCDAGGRGLLLVYDYKSGGAAASLHKDYLTGDRLALFLYLLALRQAFARNAGAQPAGVLLAPLYPNLAALDNQYVAGAPADEQLMYLYRPRGLFSTAAADLLDPQHQTGHSPVAQMQRKKDGGFHARSDAVDPADIDQRLALAEQTVLLAGAGIAGGDITVAPLVENRTLACRTCDFQPVCRFDRAFNRPRAAEAVLPRLADEDEPEEGGDE